ncbi:hypothetical protein RFM23_13080 [Mesorhizobium abyssinicae]|uniref:DUF768 domain-containing protein n=1 Tax=Mesorhizobium abyssinicae TaxID=1209958 RepID=A0ABU5AMP6_9HYPH|nr:hypothetical protein [Mesorhizobium abyssinicae]MDX8538554.1 hypothetical protein [Mesorhizobium abyssinicae]
MSTRGINFLDKRLAEHLPNATTDDPVAVELMTAATRKGISADEINEEVESVFEVKFEAMPPVGEVGRLTKKRVHTRQGPEPKIGAAREACKASWA